MVKVVMVVMAVMMREQLGNRVIVAALVDMLSSLLGLQSVLMLMMATFSAAAAVVVVVAFMT